MMHAARRNPLLKGAAIAALALAWSAPAAAQEQAPVPEGFTSIFDGKTLNGWKGDPKVWSVRDGAITAHSDTPISHNTFLILEKPYPNFEIRLKYRFLTRTGNSGLQFRSGIAEGNYVLAGMQSNITPANFSACGLPSCGEERFGMLYEELGRLEMVLLGERAVVTRRQAKTGGTGQFVRTVLGTTNPREDIIKTIKGQGEWNEDVLIVYGNRFVHAINGMVVFDATDNDPLGAKDGLIGIQAHAGPPSTAQFKDIVIRPLTSFPDISHLVSKPGPAPEPNQVRRNYEMPVVTTPPAN